MLLGCAILVWTVPSLDSPCTRERSSHQYRMELYVCMLRLFLFASLRECCAFILPSSASFLSPPPPPLRSRSSLVVGPRGPTRCVVTIAYLCTCQFTMYTTETAFGTLTTCCSLYFFHFDKSLSADMHWVFGPFSSHVGHGEYPLPTPSFN